jgi:hypothetical protein
MNVRKRESLSLACRLELEYELVQRIIERRVRAKKPTLWKDIEERIINRHLEELEEHQEGSTV